MTDDEYDAMVDEERLATIRRLERERADLRAALVGLVGADTPAELEAMEAFLRAAPAPDADKAASINAIHALLGAAPQGGAVDSVRQPAALAGTSRHSPTPPPAWRRR
jgi:hypothetical protein